ncbi:hypothetical protein FH063_004330 [Azospirillum argentinense]|uniref:Uncharacterized protein n=1 Tax=Azospirillum argentinense TaxID=2970906 RepID=A0A5B0KUE8_9PROT|nr:hypothetical protein FH063_004330 [Azospirillum argentinense]
MRTIRRPTGWRKPQAEEPREDAAVEHRAKETERKCRRRRRSPNWTARNSGGSDGV